MRVDARTGGGGRGVGIGVGDGGGALASGNAHPKCPREAGAHIVPAIVGVGILTTACGVWRSHSWNSSQSGRLRITWI